MRHTLLALGVLVLAGCGVQPLETGVAPVVAQDRWDDNRRDRGYHTDRDAITQELYKWVPESRVEEVVFRMIEPTARYGVVAFDVRVTERSSGSYSRYIHHRFTGNYNRYSGLVKVIRHYEDDRSYPW